MIDEVRKVVEDATHRYLRDAEFAQRVDKAWFVTEDAIEDGREVRSTTEERRAGITAAAVALHLSLNERH